jgi:hypothetical protein
VTRHRATVIDAESATAMLSPRPWSVAPQQGVIQGPLDLALFAGEDLRLTLAEGQLGLVERAGELQTILRAGVHDVCCDGPGCLYFVQTDQPVAWQWGTGAVLWVGGRVSRQAMPIIGTCAVTVVDVAAFHRAFLHGATTLADGHWQRVLDVVVRDQLESRLAQATVDGAADPAFVQTLLAHMAAADLAAGLEEYGLVCSHLAVYTRQAPVVETTPRWTFSRSSR